MQLDLFLKGAAIGLSIAAPVGPIGVLCIRRSIRDGPISGFVAGLGAATADAAYGCVAGFSLTTVSGFLIRYEHPLRLLGGAFLVYLGFRTLYTKSGEGRELSGGNRLLAVYATTLALTLANPATILSFVMVFAAVGFSGSTGSGAAATLVAGVFLGSALWWLSLCFGVGFFRARVSPGGIRIVNYVSGSVLLAFGVYALL